MTDKGMAEEAKIGREDEERPTTVAWSRDVRALVAAARQILFGHSCVASEPRFNSKESEIDDRIENDLRRALKPFAAESLLSRGHLQRRPSQGQVSVFPLLDGNWSVCDE